MPSYALLLLSILFTAAPAFAELEPKFIEAGEKSAACAKEKELSKCYGEAAQALASYASSRPGHPRSFGGEVRYFAGPSSFLTGQPTDRVFVLIHSYTMGPTELEHIAEEIRARGHNVFSLVLEGHASRSALGGGPFSLRNVKRNDWKEDVKFGVRIAQGLGKKVILIGYSLGGLLSIMEGSEVDPAIDAFLAVAPPVALNDKMWGATGSCGLHPVLTRGLDNFIGKYASKSAFRKAYTAEYLDGSCELTRLVTDFNRFGRSAGVVNNAFKFEATIRGQEALTKDQRFAFARIKVPYAIISSPDDQVIDHETLVRLTKLTTSKGVLFTAGAEDHLDYGLAAPGSRDRELFMLALDYLERVTKD